MDGDNSVNDTANSENIFAEVDYAYDNLKSITLNSSNDDDSNEIQEVELSQSTAETCSNDSQNFVESDHSSSEYVESESENIIANGDVITEFKKLKKLNKILNEDIAKLEKINEKLEADRCPELHELQLETLETTILQQKDEITRLKNLLEEGEGTFQKTIAQLKQDYDLKLEKVSDKK